MLALWNQMDDLFNDEWLRHQRRMPAAFTPPVDILETKKGYRLVADLPGMGPDDVDITVENGQLIISGERKLEKVEGEDSHRRIERAYGQFRRTFTLPKGVELDSIEASVEHGQLVVDVPKPVAELPRKVKVAAKAPQLGK